MSSKFHVSYEIYANQTIIVFEIKKRTTLWKLIVKQLKCLSHEFVILIFYII